MRPTFTLAYRDGIANGVGMVLSVGFTLHFIRRDDVRGFIIIGVVMLILCCVSVLIVSFRYKVLDDILQKVQEELEKEGEK